MTMPSSAGTRRWIRPLPERLVNKIAAGEVIERPAAVVKELVENALDAGADRIEVEVRNGGARLIRVVDNGCGIPAEQVEIAFSRHATSKVSSLDDLEHLGSYGFRGEALPSIASVSRTRMLTRTPESDGGTEIVVEGGVVQSVQPAAAPVGTSVEVENLFFNTPARRKFLKTETTEARHVSRMVTAMALARPEVGFRYLLDGREVFLAPPGQTVPERVVAVLGGRDRYVPVDGHEGPVRIVGMAGKPEAAQTTRQGQYLFVNRRFVLLPALSHALMSAYGEMLPRGNHPAAVLLIEVDPAEVDVNVHPAKTEIRLSREREVYDAVRHIVRQALQDFGIVPVLRSGAMVEHRNAGPLRAANPEHGISLPPRGETRSPHQLLADLYRPEPTGSHLVTVDTATGEVVGPADIPGTPSTGGQANGLPAGEPAAADGGLRLVGRFAEVYLLFEHQGELLVVDQHTAHERVLFEELMVRIENQSVVGQQLLLPVQVELTPEQAAVFEEAREVLERSGFGVAPFGGRMVTVEAVPAVLSRRSPQAVIQRVLDDLGNLKRAGYDLNKAMAESLACRAAVMAGDRLNDSEAVALVEALLRCQNRFSCPHGRPTFVKISRTDLDRRFHRG